LLVICHNILCGLHLLLLLCHVVGHLSLGLVLHLKLGELMFTIHLVGLSLLLGIHKLLLALLTLIKLHLLLGCSWNAHIISRLANPLIIITHHTLVILHISFHVISSWICHHYWLLLMLCLFGGLIRFDLLSHVLDFLIEARNLFFVAHLE